MTCRHCGRGITYRRVERDAAVIVTRPDPERCTMGEDGSEFHHYDELVYCGVCFREERHEHRARDLYFLLQGDSPGSARVPVLEFPELRSA